MTVTFHVGRSGSGKTEQMVNRIADDIRTHPQGARIYVIVPDQMSFEMDKKMFSAPGIRGSTRVSVLSMRRFALLLMRDNGIATDRFLDDTGTHLLLRRVVEMRRDDLSLFKRSVNQYGFYEELNGLVTLFKQGMVTPDQLEQLSEKDRYRALKLKDLSILYQQFLEMSEGKALHAEDFYNVFITLLGQISLQGAHIYVDGFNEFSEQELAVLVELSKQVDLDLLLTMDVSATTRPSALFGPPQRTLMRFKERLSEQVISFKERTYERVHRFRHRSLQYAEATFQQVASEPYPYEDSRIELHTAVDRAVEVEAAVREVMRLVREEGYRYRELAIVSRTLDEYGDLAAQTLRKYDMPFFLDQRQPMLDHPLIELLKATIDIALRGYREESVFRALKTEMVRLDGEQPRLAIDRLESFVIERGIKPFHWAQPWHVKRRSEEDVLSPEEEAWEQALNGYREIVLTTFEPLLAGLREAKTMRAYTRAVYAFLQDNRLAERLFDWREEALDEERLSEARKHTQVWEALLHLLEQLEAAAPDETISTELFLQMMDTGLESLRFALVPPSLDQLTVTDYVRGRLIDKKVVFLLGANEDQIPFVAKQSKLLTDQDIDFMHEHRLRVGKPSDHMFDDEMFYLYRILTAASERLWVSYALVDRTGKAIQPAAFTKEIKQKLLHDRTTKTHFAEAGEHRANDQLPFITNVNQTAAVTAVELQRLSRHYPIQELWFSVYNELLKHPQGRERIELLASALFYRNEAEGLPEPLAKRLYTDTIQTSVSRLETFNACQFQHFARYGLRLKERRLYRLEAPDIGNLYHRTIEHMSRSVKMDGKEWRDVEKGECASLAERAIELVTPDIQNAILMSSHRYGYLKKKLTDVVTQTAEVLIEQSKRDGFDPVAFELAFGTPRFPPIRFNLTNGATCELIGRIDRVDVAEVNDRLYVRIVDYKSSKRDIDFAEMYYGIAMQMLVYLKVIVEQADVWLKQHVEPAAALYFHVHRPLVATSPDDHEIERKLLDQYQMQGLLIDEPNVLERMDREAREKKEKSIVVPVKYKKDGTPDANTTKKLLRSDQLDSLMQHALDYARTCAESMYEGRIDVSPYEYKERRPCKTCPYQSVCHFDEALANEARILPKLEKEDVMKLLGGTTDEMDE